MKTYGVPKATQVDTWYEIPRQHQRQMEHQRVSWHKKFWDRPNSKILKRTPRDWGTILLAYLLFYSLLLIYSVLCGIIYYSTVSLSLPRVTMAAPGLTLEPICERMKDLNGIQYNPKYNGEVKCYVERIEAFVNKYGKKRDFRHCTLADNYGFTDKTPCIFVKINHSFGFRLQPIENATELPKVAPNELRNHLNHLSVRDRQQQAWIYCEAVKPVYPIAIKYFPRRSIPASVLNEKSGDAAMSKKYSEVDLQRVIAVQVSNIPLNENVKIKCKALAKNLEADNYINIKIKT